MRLSTVATLPAAVISTVGWSAADEMAMPRPIGSPLLGETCGHASDALRAFIDELGDPVWRRKYLDRIETGLSLPDVHARKSALDHERLGPVVAGVPRLSFSATRAFGSTADPAH
jgi:hypothetical protein